MKNILIICANVFGYNGIAKVIMNYYHAIDKEKFKIDFILINEPDENIKEIFKENKSKLYVVERNKNPFTYMSRIKKIMKENKYDLVHVHGNSATMVWELYAAKKAGIKVRIPHGHNTKTEHKILHSLLKPWFKELYSYGFACSKNAGEWLYGKDDFVVINNGIDTQMFNFNAEYRDQIRLKYDIMDKFVVGHVGIFNYQKNHEALIKIFSELKKKNNNCVLMLVGDGEERKAIVELAKTENVLESIKFIGTTDEVYKYMMAFDVFVLPSRFEGFPLVLVEAQCSGLTCVVSREVPIEADITGIVEYEDYNDIEMFAKKINNVYLRKGERDIIAKETKKTVCLKGYSIWENAKRVEELYDVYIDASREKDNKE